MRQNNGIEPMEGVGEIRAYRDPVVPFLILLLILEFINTGALMWVAHSDGLL